VRESGSSAEEISGEISNGIETLKKHLMAAAASTRHGESVMT